MKINLSQEVLVKLARSSTSEEDVHLWEKWDKSGRSPQTLKPLLQHVDPLIKMRMMSFRGLQSIPQSALEAELKRQAVTAFQRYDPSKGVALATHVVNYLKGANTFVYNYQNAARIPGARARKIGVFKSAFKSMEEDLDRPPTAIELADRLSWPVKEVTRMTTQLRSDLLPSVGTRAESAMVQMPSEIREVLELVPYELDPVDRSVFEYTFGQGGKPMLGTVEIAKVLKTSPAKVSRVKARVAKKVDAYLQRASADNLYGATGSF